MARMKLHDEGAKALAGALKLNEALTYLDLQYNLIGVEGAKAIAEALRFNQALTELDVKNNQLDGAAKQSLRVAVAGRGGFRLVL